MKAALREEVRAAATHAWAGYKNMPGPWMTLSHSLKRKKLVQASLLTTPVDAFDSFLMLAMPDEADQDKKIILSDLNFDVDNSVQVFEVTIRILGGLITAYELDADKKFLELATDLADRLLPAFNTPTGMPYRYVHLQTGAVKDSSWD